MARTFEALIKAEEEREKEIEARRVIEPEQDFQRPLSIPIRQRSKVSGQILEEYQQIKNSIIMNNPGGGIKVLLFSSPTEMSGNSTVLVNFGIGLALEGERVILVDANLRNPSLHRLLNLEMERGLIELVLGESNLGEVLKETSFNGLYVITCGNTSLDGSMRDGIAMRGAKSIDPHVILRTTSLDSQIEKMKSQAQWILFDSPSISSLGDVIALVPKVDGVVMVVEAEKTRWEVAQYAKQQIEGAKGKVLGVVLNKRRFYIPEWLYRAL